VGLIFLVLGSIMLQFLGRISGLPGTITDGAGGFFYGLAIAFLLLGLKRARGSRCSSELPPAA
jgi:hypothetical protein